MYADELCYVEKRPPPIVAGRYDPRAFPTWAEARAAYPYHSLIRIVDLAEGLHFVTPVFPQDDCSDLALDGRTYVAGWIDADGNELPDSQLPDVLRAYDAGPFIPQRR